MGAISVDLSAGGFLAVDNRKCRKIIIGNVVK